MNVGIHSYTPLARRLQGDGWDVRVKTWRTAFGRPALAHAYRSSDQRWSVRGWTVRLSARGDTIEDALLILIARSSS